MNLNNKKNINNNVDENIDNNVNDIEHFYNLMYNLSEKIITNIEKNLYIKFNDILDKKNTQNDKFMQNVVINMCYPTYNEIYKYSVLGQTIDNDFFTPFEI